MAKSTVYIESTVISYYAASRTRDLIMAAHQEITGEWWESVLPGLDPYISQVVSDERGYQTPIICTPEELMEA